MQSILSSLNLKRNAGSVLALVGLGFASAYAYKAYEAQKEVKEASGGCGCGSKKVVKNAPPSDSQVILQGGCRDCKPRAAVYNPILINPIFDPDGYQTQNLHDTVILGEEPLSYSPFADSQQRRTLLRSNLGGGI